MSDFRTQLKKAIERVGSRKVAAALGIGEISVLRMAAGVKVHNTTLELAELRAPRLTDLHAP